ncbi:IPTL-CTERM sorting domain-containing protein [Comamonas sp. JUb58]|uniref:IPTL-CTERM sorting domain-containing protein n=1 Tax=Comamonas sp. JUb58 TaxID=2485114 RepID=UPI0014150210|nr:IPTL-CTERM sorting domain-containing protein [Comamonas sp. JUb58]
MNTAWAGTWSITYTPQQTLDTPPQPVYAISPPAGQKFGVEIYCYDGTITTNPAVGVYPLYSNPNNAFVAFENLGSSPSTVAVNVTPDDLTIPASCSLTAIPEYYEVATESTNSLYGDLNPRNGYLSGAQSFNSSGDPAAPSYEYINVDQSATFMFEDPISGNPSIQANITDTGTVITNLFLNAKTTSALATFELTNPQATDTTITFTVTETPRVYANGSYDPAAYHSPGYASPTQITVTIPAGQTTGNVLLPAILPGSQVTITPNTYPGSIDGNPLLEQLTPLVFRDSTQDDNQPVIYATGTPNTTDPITNIVSSNQISFNVKLNVPPVPNVSLSCLPSEIFDSSNQIATCSVTTDVAAGTSGLSVNLNLPQSNPRYSSNCASPIIIASGATTASCQITAIANLVAGDGNVTAALSLASPTVAGEYAIIGSQAQVQVKDDDVVTPQPTATPQPVPTLGAWALGLLSALLAGFAAIHRPALRTRQ